MSEESTIEEGSVIKLWTVNGRFIGQASCEYLINCLEFSAAPEGISVNVIATGLSNGAIRWACCPGDTFDSFLYSLKPPPPLPRLPPFRFMMLTRSCKVVQKLTLCFQNNVLHLASGRLWSTWDLSHVQDIVLDQYLNQVARLRSFYCFEIS